jgi:hypothetical protein
MFRQYRVILRQLVINTCTVHLLLFCTMTNKYTQLFHKLSHCYMFRQYRVILSQLVINTLPIVEERNLGCVVIFHVWQRGVLQKRPIAVRQHSSEPDGL